MESKQTKTRQIILGGILVVASTATLFIWFQPKPSRSDEAQGVLDAWISGNGDYLYDRLPVEQKEGGAVTRESMRVLAKNIASRLAAIEIRGKRNERQITTAQGLAGMHGTLPSGQAFGFVVTTYRREGKPFAVPFDALASVWTAEYFAENPTAEDEVLSWRRALGYGKKKDSAFLKSLGFTRLARPGTGDFSYFEL